jgi:hypothetical protein
VREGILSLVAGSRHANPQNLAVNSTRNRARPPCQYATETAEPNKGFNGKETNVPTLHAAADLSQVVAAIRKASSGMMQQEVLSQVVNFFF